jgi:hypothetical protein
VNNLEKWQKEVMKRDSMGEIKISVSDKLDDILQKQADNLGIKKAELVKNFVIKQLMETDTQKGGRK